MNTKTEKQSFCYKPFLFISGVFVITWSCTVLMKITDYESHKILFTWLDFLENASPLLCALFLLRQYLFRDHFLRRFFMGDPCGILSYVLVFFLFAAQFFNFYLFRLPGTTLSVKTFLPAFIGQLFLGGGLEEGGWRGYLFPSMHRKHHVLLSCVAVSLLWVLWHLPYFFLPGTMQAGESLPAYTIIGILTGFILTVIYLLTKSVLLCMLFHSWQNTIVMVIPADTENPGFLLVFTALGIVSALICLFHKQGEDYETA